MKTPDSSLAPTGAPRRPSLFEQPDSPVRAPHREIAALAPFEAPRSGGLTQRWATAGVVAVGTAFTLLFGATIWAVINGDAPERTEPRPLSTQAAPPKSMTAPPQAAKAAPAPAAAVPLVATTGVTETAAMQDTARIITETPATAGTVEAANLSTPDPLLSALQKPAQTTVEAPPVKPVAPPSKNPPPLKSTTTVAKTSPATSAKVSTANTPAKKSKTKVEPDTVLLAALVSHVQATDAASLKTSASRDVVTADRMSSTTDLVARCDRLGGQEAKLCRNRICKGLWGLEPACPAR